MRSVSAVVSLVVLLFFLTACAQPVPVLPTATPTPRPSATTPPSPTAVPPATSTVVPSPVPTRTATPSPVPTAPPTATAAKAGFADLANLIVQGPSAGSKVAFTFDMGAELASTHQLLAVLSSGGIHATFFVTGKWVDDNPAALKAIVAAGHELGNHSYTHPDFTSISREAMLRELNRTEEAVKRVVSASTRPYFRPPFGAYDATVLKVVGDDGYRSIYWTLDSTDWRDDSTVSSVTARVLTNTGPGAIIVMHGALKKTAEALPAIIEGLRGRGLRPTSLSDLLAPR